MDPGTLHDIVRLRVDVFVVEQRCPYPEFDGRDVEPSCEHVWCSDDRGVTSYVRVLSEPGGARRIGRVCTRADARGRGLSRALVQSVLDRIEAELSRPTGSAEGPVVLDAQAHLQAFYTRLGFVQDGPEFIEDGIPHVPMRRPAPTPTIHQQETP